MMQVRVLYFASLRDRAGVREEALSVPAESTVADLKQTLGERHRDLAPALDSALVSINREFALSEEPLSDGDEIAIFPPVSGGSQNQPTLFRITESPLDLNALLVDIILPSTGAACVFTGVVRGRTERGEAHDTDHLEYEAYTPMAEMKMKQVADEIRQRWPSVEGIAVVQRIGHLEPGTPTVLIACTAAHRDTGVFEAARYGIDRLKQIVPIWKKEVTPQGDAWVEGDYRPDAQDKSG
jgi:molybdopterin converting factor subunit 1